jgi:hypothetical protein
MGICRSHRTVSPFFCYQHTANVCERCIVEEHTKVRREREMMGERERERERERRGKTVVRVGRI